MSASPNWPFKTDAGVFGVTSDNVGGIFKPKPEHIKTVESV